MLASGGGAFFAKVIGHRREIRKVARRWAAQYDKEVAWEQGRKT